MSSATPMQRRVKLLLLIPHLGGGGAERVIARLARHLDPQRFEVHLGLIVQDFPGAETLPETVQVHRFECKRVRWAAPALLRIARAVQPDIILSGMAHLSFLILLLKPLLPRHTRVLVRQNTTASSAAASPGSRFCYRNLYPLADGIVCQSQAMADDLTEHFGIPCEKIAVLANPVDIPFSLASRAENDDPWPLESWPRLLVVGRLAPEKGIDLLLRAMPEIVENYPRAHAMILGHGPEAFPLRALAKDLGVSTAATFAGHRDDVAEFYETATLFVQPSRYEGIPNALLDAAAGGLPLCATPSSQGICDLLRRASGCWLTPLITAESLAATILRALAALRSDDDTPQRFEHAFLTPFATEKVIAAYASYLEGFSSPQEPIHIAMVIPTLDAIGGAERQVIVLSKELAARGNCVTIVALSGTGITIGGELSQAGVGFLSLGMRKAWVDPRGWQRYIRWARRNRPDILHSHLPHATWFARWVRLLAPVHVQIDTLHTSRTGGRVQRLGYRISAFLNNAVTCVSTVVADSAADAGIALRQHLKIVPNGVPLPRLEPELGAASDSSAAPFRWIAVGRLAPVKDYPTLLRAFAVLPGAPCLQIVGSGPEEAALRSLAAQLKIDHRVEFAGFQSDVFPLLGSADAFVLSSKWEGLPIGALEAAAAGLPVVATNGPGTREAMLPGESGLLVPVGDAPALAEAMAAVMAMPGEERRAMGNRGRELVEERFSIGAVVDRWERLYTALLQSRTKPSRWG
jgi:glycosyltransferase involved in cell wall biosynthesis